MRRSLLLLLPLTALLATTNEAEAGKLFRDRPCGPGYVNLLYPQGFMGADFKPACRRHDRCYQSSTSRRTCDKRFFRELDRACRKSRFKLGCRMTTSLMKSAVKVFGGIARGRDAARRVVRRTTSYMR